MPRLKSTLLTQTNDKWYYKDKLYTGIIFFDKADYVVEPFEVVEGEVIKPYISLCQYGQSGELMPSPINIDSSDFCKEDLDTYGSAMMPQLHKGKEYHGICFNFIGGICDREYYTNESLGVTNTHIKWDIKTQQTNSFELYFHNKTFHYVEHSEYFDFYYFRLDDNGYKTGFTFDHDKLTNRITNFSPDGDFTEDKEYLNSPLPIPKVFDLLDNYENLFFDEHITIKISNENRSFIKKMMTKGAFQDTKSIIIHKFIYCENLLMFMDKQAFPNLQKLILFYKSRKKSTPEELTKVEELKASNPHFEIILANIKR